MSETQSPVVEKVGTAAAWGKKSVHPCTCPSGAEIEFRFPNLLELAAGDALPGDLKAVAMKELAREVRGEPMGLEAVAAGEAGLIQPLSQEEVDGIKRLYVYLAVTSVVTPKLKPPVYDADGNVTDEGDFPKLPAEDLEMLVQLAGRQRDTDGVGRSLGVEPISRFRVFGREHGCPPDCEACARGRAAVSTG
jgi:hypothetical protein